MNSLLNECKIIENKPNDCIYRKRINLVTNIETKIKKLRSYARENKLPVFEDESDGELSVWEIHLQIKQYDKQIDNVYGH